MISDSEVNFLSQKQDIKCLSLPHLKFKLITNIGLFQILVHLVLFLYIMNCMQYYKFTQ